MFLELIRSLFRARPGHGGDEDAGAGPLRMNRALMETGEAAASAEALLQEAEQLAASGRLEAALECYESCIRTWPNALGACLGKASVLVDLWSIDDALAVYERALEQAPGSPAIHSALLFHSHYRAAVDRGLLFSLHRRFGEMLAKTQRRDAQAYACPPDPDRRIRVGYVSPNFSRHSVGYFVEPLVAHHDRDRYEIFCYYDHRLADETTARIRGLADRWRDVHDATDDAVESAIRGDGIDILVDLAGHSKANRLGVFARKPAPVQMTWLGYPDTTGVTAIDYRITDAVADPEPEAEKWHTERLLRLEDVFLCYQPPSDAAPVGERHGDVVFASFNNLAKVNEPTIRMWSRILGAVPRARLVLKAHALGYPDTVDRVVACFERNGVDARRLSLRGWIADRPQHLQLYGDVDIALDTFPYNGTTTTCEALWMGIPVVSLAGAVHMSRVGATILRSAGLQEFVATGPDEYVDTAVAIAHDPGRRRALRKELRTRLQSSPLLDHEGYARRLERGYRACWAAWCDGRRDS